MSANGKKKPGANGRNGKRTNGNPDDGELVAMHRTGVTHRLTASTALKMHGAARMRAEGNSWKKVAEMVGYQTADSARQTCISTYPQLWKDLYAEARAKHMDTIEAEAVAVGRGMLRGFVRRHNPETDVREVVKVPADIIQRTVHSLLHHCGREKAQELKITGEIAHEHTHVTELDLTKLSKVQILDLLHTLESLVSGPDPGSNGS